MSLSKLLIAAVVLLGLGGLIFWVNKHPQDKTTPATTIKLLDVPDSAVQSIELTKKRAAPLTLLKNNGKWTITTPQTYSADQDAAVSMISALSGVTADGVIEDKPSDLGKYGLADPPVTVNVQEKGGKTAKLVFGDDIPASSQVYARLGNDPKVYSGIFFA